MDWAISRKYLFSSPARLTWLIQTTESNSTYLISTEIPVWKTTVTMWRRKTCYFRPSQVSLKRSCHSEVYHFPYKWLLSGTVARYAHIYGYFQAQIQPFTAAHIFVIMCIDKKPLVFIIWVCLIFGYSLVFLMRSPWFSLCSHWSH